MMMDESTSCDDAVTLESKQNNDGGTFYDANAIHATAGDIDYFKLEVKKGTWYRIGTDVDVDNSSANTVITLQSADGSTKLAQNNNVVGGSNTVESEIFYRATEDGTLCLKVEDYSTFADRTPDGSPDHTYRVTQVPLDFNLYTYYNEDAGNNDSTAMAQELTASLTSQTQQLSGSIAGSMASGDDTDVYSFTAPAGALDVNLRFTPWGTDGYGATSSPGIVRLIGADGTTVVAELNVAKGARGFSSVPVVAGEKYFFEVNRPAGAQDGSNDFYFLKFFTSTSLNEQESDDMANNDAANAQAASPQQDGDTVRHYLGGNLTAPDGDWWTVNANSGEQISVVCSSWRAGSGVRDMTIAIHSDPMNPALQSEVETEDKGLSWTTGSSMSKMPVAVTTTGKHYVHISATTADPLVTSRHYLCGIHVAKP
jgi:hypothetical protein